MIDIKNKFQEEFNALIHLFGENEVNSKISRVNEIHHYTENIWNNYVSNIPNGEVKYLLIAEAPPWSSTGRPEYFLDHRSNSRSIMNAVKKAFFTTSKAKNIEAKETLNELSKIGFLIIDSIPFSMDYSKSNKRSTNAYFELVSRSMDGYFNEKLNHSTLNWSPNLKIAFSLKRNATAIIKSLNGEAVIDNRKFMIESENIAVNGAGYPDSSKLKGIYDL